MIYLMLAHIIMKKAGLAGLIGAPALLAAGPALAQEGLDRGDTAWMLTATVIVLMMTIPGLALFYGGLVQSRNVLSVLMQCMAIACGASLLWFLGAYSIAFAGGTVIDARNPNYDPDRFTATA